MLIYAGSHAKRLQDRLLDLGCGYGLVGVWAAKQIGADKVVMCDVSENAVLLSRQNAEANAKIAYRDFPLAKISIVENRGFDVGPFIKTISELNLDNYDFIVKLHTKRNRFGIVNYLPIYQNVTYLCLTQCLLPVVLQ